MRLVASILNVEGLFCEPTSPKAVRGLSGPSHNILGHKLGADNVSCCTERGRKDPKSAFVPVAAVGTAPFGNHLRKEMANGWILNRVGREQAVGPRLEAIFKLLQGTHMVFQNEIHHYTHVYTHVLVSQKLKQTIKETMKENEKVYRKFQLIDKY